VEFFKEIITDIKEGWPVLVVMVAMVLSYMWVWGDLWLR